MEARAARFVEADDWAGLCTALGNVESETLLRTPKAAYAFGEGLYRTGRPRELAAFADLLEVSSRRDSDPRCLMRALNMAGVAAFELGEVSDASRSFETLVELAHAEGDAEMLAPAMNNLGAIADLRCRRVEAIGYYRRAIPLFETHSRPQGVAQAHHNIGLALRDRGRLDEAVEAHQRAASIAEAAGYRPLVALSLSARAECEIRRENLRLANELTARSLVLARELADPVGEGEALRVRGLVATAQGEYAEALSDFAAAEEAGEQTGNSLLYAESLRDGGRCLLSAGREAAGREKLTRAVAVLSAMGATEKARSIQLELGA